jgi:hypothetical protein
VFRGKFLSGLEQAYAAGRLTFQGSLAAMTDPATFHALVQRVRAKSWVVYAKPPFGGPEQVLKYLARYTHRVAISNRRLVSLENGRVRNRAKDHASGGRHQILELDAVEFSRRFLLHTLPRAQALALPHAPRRRTSGEDGGDRPWCAGGTALSEVRPGKAGASGQSPTGLRTDTEAGDARQLVGPRPAGRLRPRSKNPALHRPGPDRLPPAGLNRRREHAAGRVQALPEPRLKP